VGLVDRISRNANLLAQEKIFPKIIQLGNPPAMPGGIIPKRSLPGGVFYWIVILGFVYASESASGGIVLKVLFFARLEKKQV
jgi:hypothetical protein